MKNDAYFSVDFEDFTHDVCRRLKVNSRPSLKEKELFMSYEKISQTLDLSQTKTKITFFCTGLIARDYPELLRKIADDGHEIACHNYFHDNVNTTSINQLRENLLSARDILEKISKTEVLGFRAPSFSIEKNDFARLEVIASIFKYDSSLHFSKHIDYENWMKNLPFELLEFPVSQQSVLIRSLKFKTGGSYSKLFPISLTINAANKSYENGITPIFYLHPYDLYSGYNMMINWSELKGLTLFKRGYWMLRQLQWVAIFNWSIDNKIKTLCANFNNLGRLDERLHSPK